MLTFSALGKLGRAGNLMFQLASVIGIATKNGYGYGFPPLINHDHKGRFNSTEDIDLQKYFKNPLPVIDNADSYPERKVDWGWHPNLQVPDNVSLWGHMQSEKYFKHCEDLIRSYFEFDTGLMPTVPWSADEQTCFIHVRRTDYDGNYHPLSPAHYYKEAMSLFPPNMKFIVFSDEPAKAKELIGDKAIYIEGNHYMVDLYLMTQCKHGIICNSTFSWWGAWLIKNKTKLIVSPSAGNWFGAIAGATAVDIIPNEWVQIQY